LVKQPVETLSRALVALGIAAALMLAAVAARGAPCEPRIKLARAAALVAQ
jgi:hypothetical protein